MQIGQADRTVEDTRCSGTPCHLRDSDQEDQVESHPTPCRTVDRVGLEPGSVLGRWFLSQQQEEGATSLGGAGITCPGGLTLPPACTLFHLPMPQLTPVGWTCHDRTHLLELLRALS